MEREIVWSNALRMSAKVSRMYSMFKLDSIIVEFVPKRQLESYSIL